MSARLAGLVLGLLAAFAPLAARADDPATFVSVNSTYYSTIQQYDQNGNVVRNQCAFVKHDDPIYVQHQMDPRDQWYADTAYDAVSSCGATQQGLTDFELGYVRGISSDKAPNLFSVHASLIVPSGYSIAVNPRLGYGRPGATAGLTYLSDYVAGKSHYGFVSLGAGVRAYTTYPAPQLLTNATLGLNVTPGLLAIVQYFGTTHLGAGGTLQNIGVNPTVNAVYDSYQGTGTLVVKLTPVLYLDGSVTNQLAGRNIGIGQIYGFGLWAKF